MTKAKDGEQPEFMPDHIEYCVLVIDDNPSDLLIAKATLEQAFTVVTAEDGDSGYLKAIEYHPDCIVSDVRMPTMSGFTMLKKIRAHQELCDIPVVLLTALDKSMDKVHGYDLLADIYLTKPVDIDELLAVVKNAVRRYHKSKKTAVPDETPGSGISETDQLFLVKVLEAIHDNIENPDYTVAELSSAVFTSKRQLERRLQKLENISPADYIRQVRLEQAKQLLQRGTPNSIADLAWRVGFRDARQFSKLYKSVYGHSPTIKI